jgi:hypothetical protein
MALGFPHADQQAKYFNYSTIPELEKHEGLVIPIRCLRLSRRFVTWDLPLRVWSAMVNEGKPCRIEEIFLHFQRISV